LEKAREAINLDPQHPDGYMHAGFALHGMENYPAAIHEYHNALERKPDDVCTLSNLASAYLELGRNEDALRISQRAVELGPDVAECHDRLGAAYYRLGQREKAMQELAMVQRLKPAYEGELHRLLTSKPSAT
jgi:tetratricopeptide (TPR) repeat protein